MFQIYVFILLADVPPLEDMTDLIKQVDALREVKKQQQTQQTKTASVKVIYC